MFDGWLWQQVGQVALRWWRGWLWLDASTPPQVLPSNVSDGFNDPTLAIYVLKNWPPWWWREKSSLDWWVVYPAASCWVSSICHVTFRERRWKYQVMETIFEPAIFWSVTINGKFLLIADAIGQLDNARLTAENNDLIGGCKQCLWMNLNVNSAYLG